MKNLLLITFLFFPLALAGCSGEKYGSGVDPGAPKVQVRDVFLKQALMGKKVTLEGKIVSQCQSNGCWFYLQDETGQIYIDLAKSQLTLPSRPGRQVVASGTVARSKQNYALIATGVEVK
ncbi:MAG: DNA-binding protein [Desulfuromonas sp.]|nr:MAG: DNA-binding protein [Desulfuromonas sp.]